MEIFKKCKKDEKNCRLKEMSNMSTFILEKAITLPVFFLRGGVCQLNFLQITDNKVWHKFNNWRTIIVWWKSSSEGFNISKKDDELLKTINRARWQMVYFHSHNNDYHESDFTNQIMIPCELRWLVFNCLDAHGLL